MSGQNLRRLGKGCGCLAVGGVLLFVGLAILLRVFSPESGSEMSKRANQYLRENPDARWENAGVHGVTGGNPEAETGFFFVHGSPGDWTAFIDYLTDPALQDYFLASVDRPGYGQTFPGETGETFAEQAKMLAAWASQRPGQRIWVAHSFGVPIIAQLALDHPELVDGMVLVAGAMDPDHERKRWYHRLGDTWLASLVLPSAWRVANEEAIAFEKELELLEPKWSEIDCPVTIIHARDDRLADYLHVPWTMERLGAENTEVITLESGDHFILWSRRDMIVEQMKEMILRLDERKSGEAS